MYFIPLCFGVQCSADAEEVLPGTAVVHGPASAAGYSPVAAREGTQGTLTYHFGSDCTSVTFAVLIIALLHNVSREVQPWSDIHW